ncbi:hypothetical protein Leryth_001192 [Lithospermum erythrorhizon]|nr:hypothetical protein Leryth_001192 [Lithospermum erythrorhizon]
MDVEKAALRKKRLTVETSRLPLIPAEKNDGTTGQSRVREVSSRYRSPSPVPSSVRRCPSPTATRTSALSTVTVPKRAISAERKRPTTPSRSSRPSSPSTRSPSTPVQGSVAEALLATKKLAGNKLPEGLWPSTMRSLSVSFQSDTFSLPAGKREKPPPQALTDQTLRSSANIPPKQGVTTPISRKPTPERKRSPLKGKSLVDQSENSKPVDSLNARLVDQHRWPTRAGGKLPSTALTRSVDLSDKTSRASSTSLGTGMPSVRRLSLDGPGKPLQKSSSDLLMIMSSGNSLRRGSGGRSLDDNSIDKMSVAKSRPLTSSVSRPQSPNKASMLSSSLSRGVSPSRTKPTSATPSRGSSPSRVRPSSPSRQPSTSTSVLSFIVDIKKGNKAANHIEDAHMLRLLHNRHLQWRYVNARAHAVLQSQKVISEKRLYNVWRTLSDMSASLIAKRIEVQQLRLTLKLYSFLSEQLPYLDQWALIESEHMSSLSLTTQDLKDCTLRLPAIVLICLYDSTIAKCSSSEYFFPAFIDSPVEGMNSLIAELADVAAQQRAMLDECEALLASTAALQVEECSLRTNLVQCRQSLQPAELNSNRV